ncbi:MAPEG family protein [Stenotrophomonas sp. Iso1]|uniref:MAPEG family protein n=1 Tax=Stenotrophomonas sp. Iso1 TaxID=2977283 RepID=UPI0022B7A8A9|nr:MAPEG family protein [Stenotrophomonas sp. Iso1]
MNPTLAALTGFVIWSLSLLVLMEIIRAKLVVAGTFAATAFNPQNSNLSPFMQRLARAHANCIEGLPIFGGLMLIALISDRSSITDPLAYTFLAARILQSLIHLSSLSSLAVTLRFTAFTVQMIIAVYWAIKLITA